jgi:16S rRNA (adenine1518-N6/adenine1519-N6)-dimethyltransferase
MTAQTRSEVLDLLTRHGRHPVKALGQHFLADPNIVRKIVEVAGVHPGDRVLEIGAGTGTLTRALAETGARVLAYEVDGGLRPVLDEVLAGLEVDLRFEDAAEADLAGAVDGGSWLLVANLPYSVGTPILLDVLRFVPAVVRAVVMVQLEVARRLTATAGSRVYGMPTVVARLHAVPRLEFTVPPQVFVPPPRVGSAVVSLDRRPAHPEVGRALDLAAAAFAGRRKMLRRSLGGILSDPGAVLAAAGIDETARPEDLEPEDFLRLAEASRG